MHAQRGALVWSQMSLWTAASYSVCGKIEAMDESMGTCPSISFVYFFGLCHLLQDIEACAM
jgi:hypothetical protein